MSFIIPTPQNPRRVELAKNVEHEEMLADNGNIFPGHLVQMQSDGGCVPHSTEGGYAERLFATEEALISRNDPMTGANSIDTQYASGSLVSIFVAHPGDRVNALLLTGYNYPIGTKLISDGAGRLKPQSAATTTTVVKQIIAVVDQYSAALNLSTSGSVNTRTSVRVL